LFPPTLFPSFQHLIKYKTRNTRPTLSSRQHSKHYALHRPDH
jgi:hypothetical protein